MDRTRDVRLAADHAFVVQLRPAAGRFESRVEHLASGEAAHLDSRDRPLSFIEAIVRAPDLDAGGKAAAHPDDLPVRTVVAGAARAAASAESVTTPTPAGGPHAMTVALFARARSVIAGG